MRVLVVSQYFWPESFRINDVAATLVEKGVEVEVLTGNPNYPGGTMFKGYRAWSYGREVHRGIGINRVPLLARGRRAWRLALNYLSFMLSASLLGPFRFRAQKFDVVFVYATSPILQAIPAILLGWLKGCPVLLWVQDLWPESLSATGYVSNRQALGAVRQVVKFIYRHVDVILVQSRVFEAPVRALAAKTPIIYYPNSVDDSFTRPAGSDLPKIAGLDGGFPVLFAGNIGAAQAVEVIVEAASLLKDHPDIRFVVLGDGSSWAWMQDEIRRRGLSNIHLPGRFPVETMPGFMQKASALLVTLADRPIFAATVPNKVQAYMASGRPIIASLNGEGARLVTEAGAGLAVPAEDAGALAGAILDLYGRADTERKRMGDNGRRYYQEYFDHDTLVDRLIEQFQSAANHAKESR